MDKWAMAQAVIEKVAEQRVQELMPQQIAEVFCKMAEDGQVGPRTSQRVMTALMGPTGAGLSADKGEGWNTFGKTYAGGAKGGLAGLGIGGALGAGAGALLGRRLGLGTGQGAGLGALLGGGVGATGGQQVGMQKALTKMHEQPEQLTE